MNKLEESLKEYNDAMLELSSALAKLGNETAKAHTKIVEAGQGIDKFLKEVEYYGTHLSKHVSPTFFKDTTYEEASVADLDISRDGNFSR